jgi:hypothetical protein
LGWLEKKGNLLVAVFVTPLLAISLTLRRKPEQVVCAIDTYAKVRTVVRNTARHGLGQPQLVCVPGALAWSP